VSATKDKSVPVVPKVVPVLMTQVQTSLGLPKPKDYVVLLDSGASSSCVE